MIRNRMKPGVEAATLILFAALAAALTFVSLTGEAFGNPREGQIGDDTGNMNPSTCPATWFWLDILHNNDGESELIDAGTGLEDFGGVHRFATLADKLRLESLAVAPGKILRCGSIMLSSGDNFLAGPEFGASLKKGAPYYDAIAMNLIRYDAIAFGNHDFDFGPDVLADFISGFWFRRVTFVSANIDFSAEPSLQAYVDRGMIAASTVVRKKGRAIGVVGATTEMISYISSPRNVIVSAVAPAVQAEVARLEAAGVKIIILISHLQSIEEDRILAGQIHGIDVMIAGGGDELLANPWNLLVPGDEALVYGAYPIWIEDENGEEIPVITTSGGYRYIGRLRAAFDRNGRLVDIDEEGSGPVRVAGGDNPDAVVPNPLIERFVVEPVAEAVAALQTNVVATTGVVLDGLKSHIRTMETNEGDLVADALFWQAAQLAPAYDVPVPRVALQNGGGIRNASEIQPGDLTEYDTYNILPFPNFVALVPGVPREQFKEILENAVSRVEFTDGRFAQVSGFSFTFDPSGTAQVLDAEGNVVTPGSRIIGVTLDSGEAVVSGGSVQPGTAIDVATIDFLARGGDQYPFRGAAFVTLGTTYQMALANYLVDGLGGMVTPADYPEGGEGRIQTAVGGSLSRRESEDDMNSLSGAFSLYQNSPNPFNPSTTIRFALPASAPYELSIYDVAGRVVRRFAGTGQAGVNTIDWNGANEGGASVASGVYFYSLRSGEHSSIRKMILLR